MKVYLVLQSLVFLLIPLYFVKIGKEDGTYVPIEDSYDAFLQIINNPYTGEIELR